jgi:adenosyl cobinamide kinase/adenosyl cobinamide phosphate guanylyltransferase
MVMDQMLKSTIGVTNTEDLIIEALRDLVKDEIKHYVRQKINENPEIKQELKEAVADFIDAKMRETYAIIKMGKCVAELGIQIVPAEMKEKLGKDVASLLEKEMSGVLDKI